MLVTVFTPTYNRADKIHRVWNSLKKQTVKTFEWIIVDDGSNDNIQELVNEYSLTSEFPIKFYKNKTNRGKHIAINKGVELAGGKYFLIADSDDEFESNTIEFFLKIWDELEKESDEFCAVRVCCKDQFGKRISSHMKYYRFDATMQEAVYKHKFWKESWSMDRVDLLKIHKFPDTHKGYFPEGIIWKEISKNKKIRFVDELLRIYYVENSGLMKNRKPSREKISRSLAISRDILKNDITFFIYRPTYFLFIAIVMSFYSLLNKSYFKEFSDLSFIASVLLVFSFPFAIVKFTIDKLKY